MLSDGSPPSERPGRGSERYGLPVYVSYTLRGMGYTIVGGPWASEVSAALYPDLVQSGGLSQSLRSLLPADVTVAEEISWGKVSPGWAFIRKGPRRSQVCTAQHERAFCVDFRNRGFMYGEGWTRDLREVARAIEIFLVQEGSTARMKSEFSWFVDEGGELILEKPAASFVVQCWQNLEKRLTSEEESSTKRLLAPLVSEAAKRPELRQLRPFTSLFWLCFSRTTAFPRRPLVSRPLAATGMQREYF